MGLKIHDGIATQPSAEEEVSTSTLTFGANLGKSVFSVGALDGFGHVLRRKDLQREPFGLWLAQLPDGTTLAMEAFSGAHHGARHGLAVGLEPRIIAAQFVSPFPKARKTKSNRDRSREGVSYGAVRQQRNRGS